MNYSLSDFYEKQIDLETHIDLSTHCYVANVLSMDYDSVTIATCDGLEVVAGNVLRGGLLIMMGWSTQAILLRVRNIVSSPIASVEQQVAYELAKRLPTNVDAFTRFDYSYRCHKCDILGAFIQDGDHIYFSGSMDSVFAPIDYRVFVPDESLLQLIVNAVYDTSPDGKLTYRATEYSPTPSTVPTQQLYPIGHFRPAESDFHYEDRPEVRLNLPDLCGKRAALFGKTRGGKSNTLKVIASAMIETKQPLGQLIIDTNGEYANDNPQDGKCLLNRYRSDCEAYAIAPKSGSGIRILKINFYMHPELGMNVIRSRLYERGASVNYVQSFINAKVPSLADINALPVGDRTRAIRRVLYYWIVLFMAGFIADEAQLAANWARIPGSTNVFDPAFCKSVLDNCGFDPATYKAPASLTELRDVLRLVYEQNRPMSLKDSSGNDLFDPEDRALLDFAFPSIRASGPSVLSGVRNLHDSRATNFIKDICDLLDQGKTVILDTSHASPDISSFLVDKVCSVVFHHQEQRFADNALGDRYVQLYIEEAHNYFPAGDKDNTSIYTRIAKEGAKYHLGLTYATQSPSTISGELLSQTENFFVAHMDSQLECDALSKRSAPFAGISDLLLRIHTPGYLYMLSASQRYPIPVQIRFYGKGGAC